MKKFTKATIAALVLVIFCALFGLVACSKGEVSLEVDTMPQSVYELGESLNLSDGQLKVTTGNKSENISLASGDVTVSGYDKDKLGKQELTVEYNGVTTTFSVVVRGMTADNKYTADYFVGETFDKSKGTLTVYDASGSTSSVAFSNSAVTVKSFDITVANTTTAVVEYATADYTYSCTISVNVYEVDSINLTRRPNNVAYKSHETELDMTGSLLTITGNGGKVTKYVTPTADMVSGFDPSVATIDNLNTPLSQQLTISYAGKTFNFNVQISYSAVSLMELRAEELASLNWTGSSYPQITEAQGENAIDAISRYFLLSTQEQELVSEEAKLTVARVATVYGNTKWQKLFASYNNTFTVNDDGELVFVAGNYEKAVADAEKLSDTTSDLWVIGQALVDIYEAYGENVIIGEETIEDHLSTIIDPDSYATIAGMLEYMFEVYDQVKDKVSADWTEAELKNNANILNAIKTVVNSDYCSSDYVDMYDAISSWLTFGEDKDFLNMMYSYCYINNDSANLNKIKEIGLVDPISLVYEAVESAYTYYMYIELYIELYQQSGTAIPFDLTSFMWNYRFLVNQANDIKTNGSDFIKWVYNNVEFESTSGTTTYTATFDDFIDYYKYSDYGYYSNMGALIGTGYESIWEDYLSAFDAYLTKYNTDGTLKDAYKESTELQQAYATAVEKLFNNFVKMPASWQYEFISAVNLFYSEGAPELAFDYTATTYSPCLFTKIVADYYNSMLNETQQVVLKNLLFALEKYDIRYLAVDDGATSNISAFIGYMDTAKKALDELNDSDKTIFTETSGKLNALYSKYNTILTDYSTDGTHNYNPELSEANQAKFDELALNISRVITAYSGFSSSSYPLYAGLLTAFEKAETIVEDILSSNDEALIKAYYQMDYAFADDNKMSLEFAFCLAREMYTSLLVGLTIDNEPIIEMYNESGLKSFFITINDTLWKFITASEDATHIFTDEEMRTAVNAYNNLSASNKVLLYNIDSIWFYSSILLYAEQEIADNDNVEAIVTDILLIDLYEAYYELYYEVQPETASKFLTAMTSYVTDLKKSYEALSEEDKAKFDANFLKGYYDSCIRAYEEIVASQNSQAEAA